MSRVLVWNSLQRYMRREHAKPIDFPSDPYRSRSKHGGQRKTMTLVEKCRERLGMQHFGALLLLQGTSQRVQQRIVLEIRALALYLCVLEPREFSQAQRNSRKSTPTHLIGSRLVQLFPCCCESIKQETDPPRASSASVARCEFPSELTHSFVA